MSWLGPWFTRWFGPWFGDRVALAVAPRPDDAAAAERVVATDVAVGAVAADVADLSITADATAPRVALGGAVMRLPIAQRSRGDCQPMWLDIDATAADATESTVASAFVGDPGSC